MRKMYGGMSTARYIIIGVSVVIIFAIIGVLVWYLIKQNKKKEKENGNTPPSWESCPTNKGLDPPGAGCNIYEGSGSSGESLGTLTNRTLDQCKADCINRSDCSGITWAGYKDTGHPDPTNMCYLLSGDIDLSKGKSQGRYDAFKLNRH